MPGGIPFKHFHYHRGFLRVGYPHFAIADQLADISQWHRSILIALERAFQLAIVRFFAQRIRIKFAEGTDHVEEKFALWSAQVKWLLDRFEIDVQRLQLVDDLQRTFQPACQAVNLMDIQDLELASPGGFQHGIDPGAEFLTIS